MQRIQVKQQIKANKNLNKQISFLSQVNSIVELLNSMSRIFLMLNLISKSVVSISIEVITSLAIAPQGSRVYSKIF